jgi:hypothetical protein
VRRKSRHPALPAASTRNCRKLDRCRGTRAVRQRGSPFVWKLVLLRPADYTRAASKAGLLREVVRAFVSSRLVCTKKRLAARYRYRLADGTVKP